MLTVALAILAFHVPDLPHTLRHGTVHAPAHERLSTSRMSQPDDGEGDEVGLSSLAWTDGSFRAVLALNMVTVIWGSQHAVIKGLVEVYPPSAINAVRFCLHRSCACCALAAGGAMECFQCIFRAEQQTECFPQSMRKLRGLQA